VKSVLACVQEHHLADKRLLVPQGYVPTLHYYFPKAALVGYRDPASFAVEQSRDNFAAVIAGSECQVPLRR
jgi:hypothetical protein